MKSSEGNITAKNRQAYVFYATDNTYALAVLVFVKLLREKGETCGRDVILLHLPLAKGLLKKIRDAGIIPRAATTPRKLPHKYYRECLLKLRIFELVEYERIVYMDVDAIPLRSLGALFSMQLDLPIAAPLAYWLPHHFWTSSLLVVKPSLEIKHRLAAHVETLQDDNSFDMDIINATFANEIQTLPAEYFCLDSEWEVAARPGHFANRPDILDLILVVHFSTLAKPWRHAPQTVRRMRPGAHPAYYDFRRAWWDAMKEVLHDLPGPLRAAFRLSRLLNVRVPVLDWKERKVKIPAAEGEVPHG